MINDVLKVKSLSHYFNSRGARQRGGEGGGYLGNFFSYVLGASHSPYPIIVYSVANYRQNLGKM